MKICLALFFGGESSEYEVSLASAASVLRALRPARYEILPVGITRDGHWLLSDPDPEKIRSDRWQSGALPVLLSPDKARPGLFIGHGADMRQVLPDLLLPILHGGAGEDGRMQGLFSLSGIRFLGCNCESAALCMNKALAKALCERIGIPVLPAVTLTREKLAQPEHAADEAEAHIGYPAFVKPARAGSSLGAGRADNRSELLLRLREAAEVDDCVLVEECVRAREIELAVYERNSELCVAGPGEIRVRSGFYGYREKYRDTAAAELLSHPQLQPNTVEALRSAAARIFRLLGCRGLARVDFFVCGDTERFFFNEINTLPGFTDISMFPRLAAEGSSLSDLLDLLIDEALRDDRRL